MASGCIMEKTFKVPFEEINLVRIRCKDCGEAAVEMPLAALVNGTLMCPGCGKDLRKAAANVDAALTQVANGIAALRGNPKIDLQFVLPVKDQS